jgi:MFS superfamily sulfate permease-like transporter
VVIAAAVSLTDVKALRRYWRVRPSAVLVSLTTTAGVILVGVLEGIVFAIGLSILLFFRSNWWPHGDVLALRGDDSWHSVNHVDGGEELPGIVVFRWEAPLFFANSGAFRRQVWALVEQKKARWVVLQCEAITDIDVTAADMMEQLDNDLDELGVHIAFVELRTRLHRQVGRYGLFEKALNREHFYDSIDTAVAAIAASDADDAEAPG